MTKRIILDVSTLGHAAGSIVDIDDDVADELVAGDLARVAPDGAPLHEVTSVYTQQPRPTATEPAADTPEPAPPAPVHFGDPVILPAAEAKPPADPAPAKGRRGASDE